MITVDNRTGVVTKVTSRYVVVRSARRHRGDRPERDAGDDDGAEPFVHVAARSASPCRCRSPTTATSTARSKLLERSRSPNRGCCEGPRAGRGVVQRSGDNGIDARARRLGQRSAERQGNCEARSTARIWTRFAENGIQIPSPQRDVRIDRGHPGAALDTHCDAPAARDDPCTAERRAPSMAADPPSALEDLALCTRDRRHIVATYLAYNAVRPRRPASALRDVDFTG